MRGERNGIEVDGDTLYGTQTLADFEFKGWALLLATYVGVKDLAVLEFACVSDRHGVSLLWEIDLIAFPQDSFLVSFPSRRGCDDK